MQDILAAYRSASRTLSALNFPNRPENLLAEGFISFVCSYIDKKDFFLFYWETSMAITLVQSQNIYRICQTVWLFMAP